jgi:hypothetical protein
MTEDASSGASEHAPRAWLDLRRTRIAGAVAVVLVLAFVLWLVLRDGGSHSGSPVPKGAKAVPVSLKGLRTLAALGIPIYWVGEQPGVDYELTKTADNRVFISYLPLGVPIGSSKPYLTVGTYPLNNAFAVTSRRAARNGSDPIDIGNDGVAFSSRKAPESVFLAYRGSGVQIEVFDPTPGRARDLVRSRRVTAVP